MRIFYVTLILAVLAITNSQINSCHSSCGGSTEFDCADYNLETSSSSKCYSCAPGYVGGSGGKSVNSAGATCKKGTCSKECSSCQNENDSSKCYLCSYGYFDETNDRSRATPCKSCHSSCLSCSGPSANECLTCQIGYFDSLQSPYMPGSCEKCDSSCSYCEGERDSCGSRCCSKGFGANSQGCVVSKGCFA